MGTAYQRNRSQIALAGEIIFHFTTSLTLQRACGFGIMSECAAVGYFQFIVKTILEYKNVF